MDTTPCPECGALAEVLWRDVLESTEGPVEHAKIGCINRHWFLLPLWRLEQPTPIAPRRPGESAAATAGPVAEDVIRMVHPLPPLV